jgi:hypothetical protein
MRTVERLGAATTMSCRVTGRIEHDCDDDPAALDHAAKLATSSGVEVWVGARLVGRVTREQKPPEDSDRTSP